MTQVPQGHLRSVTVVPLVTAKILRPVGVYFVVHEDDDLSPDLARLVDVVRHIGIEPEVISFTDVDPVPSLLAATKAQELPCAIVLLRTANVRPELADRMTSEFLRERPQQARLQVAELGPSYATIVDELEHTVHELRSPWTARGPRDLFIGDVSEIEAELTRRGLAVPATVAPPQLSRDGHVPAPTRRRGSWPVAAFRALTARLH